MTSAKREPDRPVDITGMAAQPRRTDPDFELLIQHAIRTLDASTALRFRDQKLHSTVYGAAQLLVRPTSGFGVWSGTSFAAPILAGELAQYLTVDKLLACDDVDPSHAIDRGWEAISNRVPDLRRPGQGADDEAVDHEAEDTDYSAGGSE